MTASSSAYRGSLIERLRRLGIPEDKIPAVAVEATIEALEIAADSRRAGAELVDPSGPRGFQHIWWSKKFAAGVARCSMKTLERRIADGTIRANRENRRCVFVLGEDVMRCAGHVSQRVA